MLARVSGLFARRGFNIVSLAVAPTEDERLSRITMAVDAASAPLEQVTKQLFKLINVVKITELDPRDAVQRELLLVTVKAPGTRPRRGDRARRSASRGGSWPTPTTSSPCPSTDTRTDSTTSRSSFGPFGIVELQRTGRVALPKI